MKKRPVLCGIIQDLIVFLIMLAAAAIFAATMTGGCDKHRSTDTKITSTSSVANLKLIHEKAEFYLSIQRDTDVQEEIYKDRCDKLTFMAHTSGTGYIRFNLDPFESGGTFNRDIDPCFPEYSRSTISFDGLLGVLHHAVAHKDIDVVNRMISFGEKNNWKMGEAVEGNEGLVVIPHIAPLMYLVRDYLTKGRNGISLAASDNEMSEEFKKLLSGFRGHLLASYLWLRLRTVGYLYDLELASAASLVKASPTNPIYSAILSRATDGNQDTTMSILLDITKFPDIESLRPGELPTEVGVDGWGGCPVTSEYLLALSIMDGK